MTSSKPILYYWSNTLNFEHFLLYLEETSNDVGGENTSVSQFELIAGKTTQEVLDLLGDQVSLVVDKSPEESEFPIPLTLFVVEVTSVEQLKIVMENIVAEYEIPAFILP